MLKELFGIFSKCNELYFKNIHKFLGYMAFPVLGQILGICWILGLTFLYTQNVTAWAEKVSVFNNVMMVFIILLILVLPGFFIFCKAFWDYMVSMISLNTMANTLLTSKSLSDMVVHKELARRRTGSYVLLLLVLSLIYLIFALPIFWVFMALFAVYSALTFQVFALQDTAGPISAIKESFNIIKSNFLKTFLLLIIMFLFTYLFLPYLMNMFFDFFGINYIVAKIISPVFSNLPIEELNQLFASAKIDYRLSPLVLGEEFFAQMVYIAVIGFTLPLRCLCFTKLYKDGTNEYGKPNEKAKSTKKGK